MLDHGQIRGQRKLFAAMIIVAGIVLLFSGTTVIAEDYPEKSLAPTEWRVLDFDVDYETVRLTPQLWDLFYHRSRPKSSLGTANAQRPVSFSARILNFDLSGLEELEARDEFFLPFYLRDTIDTTYARIVAITPTPKDDMLVAALGSSSYLASWELHSGTLQNTIHVTRAIRAAQSRGLLAVDFIILTNALIDTKQTTGIKVDEDSFTETAYLELWRAGALPIDVAEDIDDGLSDPAEVVERESAACTSTCDAFGSDGNMFGDNFCAPATHRCGTFYTYTATVRITQFATAADEGATLTVKFQEDDGVVDDDMCNPTTVAFNSNSLNSSYYNSSTDTYRRDFSCRADICLFESGSVAEAALDLDIGDGFFGYDDIGCQSNSINVTMCSGCCSASDCNDNNSCTTDSCVNGSCRNTNNSNTCNDGDGCTVNDRCSNGVCRGTPRPCDDGNQCTNDSCSNGSCRYTNNTNTCDDGNGCTVNDRCSSGVCRGTTRNCDDGNVCTDESCSNGSCRYTNNTNSCNDNNGCTENDRCSGGQCSGTARNCGDNNPCTNDSCSGGTCSNVNNSNSCNDGNGCTVNDRCSGGQCSGTARNCDDNNPCTNDSCSGGSCSNVNNSNACNDSLYCNGTDNCSGGSCSSHSGNPCSGSRPYCDEGSDRCGECTTNSQCNDSNACTTDTCSGVDCQFSNNSNACTDGVFCNGTDNCSGGTCSAHSGNPCPGPDGDNDCSEVCNESSNSCTANDPNGSTCTDNNGCTNNDQCSGGQCSGTPQICDDGLACSIDSCVSGSCQYDLTPCDCTVDAMCDDLNLCTDDTCENNECYNRPNTNPCDDGNDCTDPDRCANGTCTGDDVIDCCDSTEECESDGDCFGNLPFCMSCDCVECRTDNDCTQGTCSNGVCGGDPSCTELVSDMDCSGFRSIIGDVPNFVDCLYRGVCECPCPGTDPCLCSGDCNCDGFLSIIGDVPCFVDCVYRSQCLDQCPSSSVAANAKAAGATIGGAVFSDRGDPLGSGVFDVLVEVFDTDGNAVASVTSGEIGLWRVDGLVDGTYHVVFESEGKWLDSMSVDVNAENTEGNQSILLLPSRERKVKQRRRR